MPDLSVLAFAVRLRIPQTIPADAAPSFRSDVCPLPDLKNSTTMNRTMIDVNIDRGEPVALHDQVAAEIRRAIAEGEAGPGDRLPLAKDLAAVLGVNKNTVLRAMHILRDEGLLEFTRGRGITVAASPDRSAVVSKMRELIEFGRRHGYRREELLTMMEALS
jgi:GntR family transcriptional regulator